MLTPLARWDYVHLEIQIKRHGYTGHIGVPKLKDEGFNSYILTELQKPDSYLALFTDAEFCTIYADSYIGKD